MNYFLIPGKPALLHIHYNIAIGLNEIISRFARLHRRRMKLANILSACLAFSRFPEKKNSATQGSAEEDHCLKFGTFRRLSWCLDPLSRFIIYKIGMHHLLDDLNLTWTLVCFFETCLFFSIRHFKDFAPKLKSDLYEIPHLHKRFFFSTFSFSFFYLCFIYCINW